MENSKKIETETETKIPICKKCGKEFIFDQEEPFAYCDCGTTEWGYTGNIFRDIQKENRE